MSTLKELLEMQNKLNVLIKEKRSKEYIFKVAGKAVKNEYIVYCYHKKKMHYITYCNSQAKANIIAERLNNVISLLLEDKQLDK